MPSTQHTGKAGQFAVMGEFALRGYNVAMPEVDVGDDVYIFNDATNALWRIQVKTSKEYPQKSNACYQYGVKKAAITRHSPSQLFFIFVMRFADKWDFVVISLGTLLGYLNANQIGKQKGDNLTLNLYRFTRGPKKGKVFASRTLDVTRHVNDWAIWPAV